MFEDESVNTGSTGDFVELCHRHPASGCVGVEMCFDT